METYNAIAVLSIGLMGLVMLFAQVQLFSIAKEVKKIRELLEEKTPCG